uniref:C2 calcium/lipid-binding domain, CaLB n=1 Tax=Tanacetum cinerariifolium TaxID=118510 RepID=A0A6L2LB34_TANCI|nr:C2 calcium/lipid-binding domain, CaLB [Tanacetum cinerariifolium]
MIDDDLFTCDIPLGMIFNEFNRSVEQNMDDLDNGNLDVYERRLCYDECEKIYGEAVIFINKRFVRLIEIIVEQWLDLKYSDHAMVSNEVKESVFATWLIQSYKKQFEEYMEIEKQKKVYGLDVGIEYDPSGVYFSEWLALNFSNHKMMDRYTKNVLWDYWIRGDDEEVITDDELSNPGDGDLIEETEIDVDVLTNDNLGFNSNGEYKDAWIYEWNKDVPWVANIPWLDYGPWMELSDDIEHVCKPFRFKNGHAKIFNDHAGTNNDYETQENKGFFDEHKLIRDDDDDIGDLEDYLIQKDPPYYVNEEEEERSKKRRCKLHRIPYGKPPTCKSKKFKVVKYSVRPTKKYVIIKEYEYDIWV